MCSLEKEVITERIHGMTNEEKEISLRAFPTTMLLREIERRDNASKDILRDVYGTLSEITEDMTLPEIQNVIKKIKQQVRG